MIHNLALIDDEEISRFITAAIVQKATPVQHIHPFGSVAEALSFFRINAKNPDILPEIVLLDINMPIMDGWKFMEEYIKLKPTLSRESDIFLLTSSSAPQDMARASHIAEVRGFLKKPLTIDTFKQVVKGFKNREAA
jgi:CheY-like chemotaxis protein